MALNGTGEPARVAADGPPLSQFRQCACPIEAIDQIQPTDAFYRSVIGGRLARAKQAHDEVITTIYRAQADALEIESLAKRRLADEYDAAQDRGEIRTRADNQALSSSEKASWADIGLSHKEIHEARAIRDAEFDTARPPAN